MGLPFGPAEYLSDHQMQVVEPDGNIFVNACPGSGKTRSAAARAASVILTGRRIAICSYTNTGVEQIRAALCEELQIVPGPETFVGTLHSFLLRFVYYPFGHLVMGCSGSPRLIQSTDKSVELTKKTQRVALDKFQFADDGSLFIRKAPPKLGLSEVAAAAAGQAQALKWKAQLARAGYATFDDSMHYALRVLREHTSLANSIARRFDEIMVDEAQDTSQAQMSCLRALISTGQLGSLALIGDLDQSIYSFNGAAPSACVETASAHGLAAVDLTENYRSSQAICDVVARFGGIGTAYRAVGPDADFGLKPQLTLYDPDDPSSAVVAFEAAVAAAGLPISGAVVLTRNNDMVDRLNGSMSLDTAWPAVRALQKAVSGYLQEGTLTTRQVRTLEDLVIQCTWGVTRDRLDADDLWAVRKTIMTILAELPPVAGLMKNWLRDFRTVAEKAVTAHFTPANVSFSSVIRSNGIPAGTLAADVLVSAGSLRLAARTVHDVKGETHDSVLIVADFKSGSRKRSAQAELWSRPLRGEAIAEADAEEHRIAFVALSRARRLCVLSLPTTTPDEVITSYLEAGFDVS